MSGLVHDRVSDLSHDPSVGVDEHRLAAPAQRPCHLGEVVDVPKAQASSCGDELVLAIDAGDRIHVRVFDAGHDVPVSPVVHLAHLVDHGVMTRRAISDQLRMVSDPDNI